MYDLNDIVMLKKPHTCGTNRWKIVRMGMDIRLECLGCNHRVLMSRRDFEKRLKKIIKKSDIINNKE